MDLFADEKLKGIEERLKTVEVGHGAILEHLHYISKSVLVLSTLLEGMTTREQRVGACTKAEVLMARGGQTYH